MKVERKENGKTVAGVDEIEPRRTMMSYAFKSFSPREITDLDRDKDLRYYARRLFSRFEELQELTLYRQELRKEEPKVGKEVTAGGLGSIAEIAIKNWVGLDAYRQGLQHFMKGRVAEKKVSQSVLTGRVSEETANGSGDPASYLARIEFKKRKDDVGESAYHHLSAWCECLDRKAGEPKRKDVCAHIAAVLISWTRDPGSFSTKDSDEKAEGSQEEEYQFLSSLARATDRVFSALEEMISFMFEEKTCSNTEVLEMLQMMYSNMKVAANQVSERWKDLSPKASKEEFEIVLGFSFITNVIISRILVALDMKYKNGIMQTKNTADADVIKKMIEDFVEMSTRTSRIELKHGQTTTIERSVQSGKKESQLGTNEKNTKKTSSSTASRSWDRLVEEFASN